MTPNPTPAAILSPKDGLLQAILPDSVVRRVLHDYLKKHEKVSPQFVETVTGVMYRVSGASVYFHRGQLTVEIGAFRHKEAAVWKREILSLLDRAGALLFQKQVRDTLAASFPISQEQQSSAGALVLSTELRNPAAPARIAILPDGRIAVFLDATGGHEGPAALEALRAALATAGLING